MRKKTSIIYLTLLALIVVFQSLYLGTNIDNSGKLKVITAKLGFEVQSQKVHFSNTNSNEIFIDTNVRMEPFTEHFWSNKIGFRDSFRIELDQIRNDAGVYVDIELFKRVNNKWTMIQEFSEEKDGISSLSPKVVDMNNDGAQDVLFQTATAARGANVVKTLFIFDTLNYKLVKIRNSSYYPNLQYNEKLNCLDAHMFYAGSTTVFLKIVKDTLQEFANVSIMNQYLSIEKIYPDGTHKILNEIKVKNFKYGDYDRFSNYNPLTLGKDEYGFYW